MKLTPMTQSLSIILTFFSLSANAVAPQELNFKSKFDQFTLKRVGGHYNLGSRRVQIGSFDQLLPLFSSNIEGDCSSTGKPDLTVKAKVAGENVQRHFYVKNRLVSDGKNCAPVTGDGIFFIPLHKSWFEENEVSTIAIESPLKISKGEEVLAAFQLVNGEWRGSLKDQFPNWEFFSTFVDNLKEFPVTHRVHKDAAIDKPSFTMKSGKRKIEFYKLGGTLWVAAIPGKSWLIGSSAWTSWVDMEKSQWTDRSAPQLLFIADRGKQLDERKGTLASLEGQWTPSIRDLLYQLMLDETESPEIKVLAVRQLKSKPTIGNMGLLVQALRKTNDSEVQYAITSALRVRHPKGRVIQPEMEEGPRLEIVKEWEAWAKEQKNFTH